MKSNHVTINLTKKEFRKTMDRLMAREQVYTAAGYLTIKSDMEQAAIVQLEAAVKLLKRHFTHRGGQHRRGGKRKD